MSIEEKEDSKWLESFSVGFALLIWAIVGLFFWIPLMSRAVGIFSFTLLSSAITGKHAALPRHLFVQAQTFYAAGFRNIRATASQTSTTGNPDTSASDKSPEASIHDILTEVFQSSGAVIKISVFAALFWISCILFFLMVYHIIW